MNKLQEISRRLEMYGVLLYPPDQNQILLRVEDDRTFLDLVRMLAGETVPDALGSEDRAYHLATVVANDERELEDRCFKIYYVFSHSRDDVFIIVEYLLGEGEQEYPSIASYFPAVRPFEREMGDLMGLFPKGEKKVGGEWLHAPPYPASEFYPLRRDVSLAALRERMWRGSSESIRSPERPKLIPRAGYHILPVGPIHAGLIEPGRFLFEIGGEVIERVHIQLGYTHKGIERLFQSTMSLLDGWRLAEQVAGDSPFAHSLAYSHAVETLMHIQVHESVRLVRGILLELERVYNHVSDMAALAHDVALHADANELALQREQLLRLNAALTGSRFLRGVNRVGGLRLPHSPDVEQVLRRLQTIRKHVEPVIQDLARLESFRDRTVNTGILTREDALRVGATGLVARASGLNRDYRLNHPWGPYAEQTELREALYIREENVQRFQLPQELQRGDVHARFLMRAWEFLTSMEIIEELLRSWPTQAIPEPLGETSVVPDPASDYAFALGYAEGWRGDIVYWVMQDKLGSIYRCKVRDPSMLNWPALPLALVPHESEGERVETILPDFPLINKSFNLSYTGNDL